MVRPPRVDRKYEMNAHTIAKRKALHEVADRLERLDNPDTPASSKVPIVLPPLPQTALSWAILWAQFSAVAMANLVLMGSLAMDSIAATQRRNGADSDSGV
jgi:hypothetical protein